MASPPRSPRPRGHDPGAASDYWSATHEPVTAALLVLPLFIAYQIGVLIFPGALNGVDFVTAGMIHAIQWCLLQIARPDAAGVVTIEPAAVHGVYLGLNAGLTITLVALAWVLRRRGRFRAGLWPRLVAESSLYALMFSGVVFTMMHALGVDRLLQVPALAAAAEALEPAAAVIASIGAGLYEELVFRLALMGGLYALLIRYTRAGPFVSALLALIVSSAIFSGVHHVGPRGEIFTLATFSYRFFAGVLLAVIFHLRGFAVAVYTHALYDVLVLAL